MVVGRALVQDLFTGPERTRMMAFVGMTMGLVPPTATLLGGQIHVRWGWQANFILLAVTGCVLLLAAWRVLPAAQAASGHERRGSPLAGYARLAREPAFLLFVAISASTTAAFYTFLSGAPIVLAGYGVTPERIGWFIMWPPMAYIVGNILTSRLVHRLGDRRIMALGQWVTFGAPLGLLLLGLAGLHSPLWLAAPMVLMGIGHGLLVPPTLAGTVGVLPALAGSAAAVAGLMQQLVGAAGGYTVGLVPHQGPVNLAWLMLGWTLLGAVALWLLRRVQRHARG
jgi:DHA1 family bicyclomycin/chloramphenicol resistance-like MFS transporter